MLPATIVHVKALLAVLTAALGTVAGGSMINAFNNDNGNNQGSFVIAASPSVLTVGQGYAANSTVTVTSLNGYSGTVTVSVYYPGGKLSTVFNPTKITVPRDGVAKSTLTITVPLTATIGNYTLLVIGSAQRKTAYAASPIIVHVTSNKDFAIASQLANVLNLQGTANTVNIMLTSVNGYNGTINLQATVPFGYITVTGAQNSLALLSGQTVTSTLTISTTTQTLPGTYLITVTGTSGGVSHSTTITLAVTDPVITESLELVSYRFNTGTNLTLSLRNTGTTTVILQSYSIMDATGNSWSFTWPNGPAIAPGATVAVNMLIAVSCNTCTYSGIFGLFMQFSLGQSYAVTLTTKTSYQFSFVVVSR
ncbi:MAG TPA: hypothetical protein VFE98_03790 [Candidatus Bathyarchaeia archaeon]|nr:hypothetical protein [Candidatus Bathyarchaeia archaeon]